MNNVFIVKKYINIEKYWLFYELLDIKFELSKNIKSYIVNVNVNFFIEN